MRVSDSRSKIASFPTYILVASYGVAHVGGGKLVEFLVCSENDYSDVHGT